ncbi:MAG: hypothetical protein H6718_26390 [Polyangiaceae bacterium]|nr:hypothetical protein [Polyangiaceae bacterium]
MNVIGLWYEDEFPWPDPRELVGPPLEDKVQIVAYLRSGVRVHEQLGYSHCRFPEGPPPEQMGNCELTDGTWIWPEGLWVYVHFFDVRLPDEFIQHVRGANYRHDCTWSEELEMAPMRHAFWNEWSRSVGK